MENREQQTNPHRNESDGTSSDDGGEENDFLGFSPLDPLVEIHSATPPASPVECLEELSPQEHDLDKRRLAETVHVARFTLDVICAYSQQNKGSLLDVAVKKLRLLVPNKERYSDSSGYTADHSSLSGGNRVSASSSSSSASQMIRNCVQKEPPSGKRIAELKRKWMNSTLVYNILECLDNYFDIAPIPEEDEAKASEPVKKRKGGGVKRVAQKRPHSESSGSATKRRRERKSDSSSSESWVIGKSVFAEWMDRKYYAGEIIEKYDSEKYLVQFYDGRTRRVHKLLTINNSLEMLNGRNVMVYNKSQDRYFPGLIVDSHSRENLTYTAVTDDGDLEVPVTHIFFTEKQMRQVRREMGQLTESSSPQRSDDCQTPKRVTRSQSKLMSPKPCTSGTKPAVSDISSEELTVGNDGCVHGVEPEVQFFIPSPDVKIKLKNVRGKASKRPNPNDDNIVGPIVKGTFFQGLTFILTCSEKMHMGRADDSSTDNENFQFTAVPFVYDRLELQIRTGGGELYHSLSDVPNFKITSVYLVAPRPCCTAKYVEAMAAGVKMICHEWIVNCCKKRKRTPMQELPVGWSLERGRFVSYFERGLLPFEHVTIQIADGGDTAFYNFWCTVCGIAGAKVVKYHAQCVPKDIVLVKDGVFLEGMCKGACVVNTFWVIQCLIHGEIRNPGCHVKYGPNYEGSDTC